MYLQDLVDKTIHISFLPRKRYPRRGKLANVDRGEAMYKRPYHAPLKNILSSTHNINTSTPISSQQSIQTNTLTPTIKMKSFTAILFLAAVGAVTAAPTSMFPPISIFFHATLLTLSASDEESAAFKHIAMLSKRSPVFTNIVQLSKRDDCGLLDPCHDSETGCRSESHCIDGMNCSGDLNNGGACAAGK
jgi:hypothetical protein